MNDRTANRTKAPKPRARAALPGISRHLRAFSAEVAELKAAAVEPPAEMLAHWLAVQYVAAARAFARKARGGAVSFEILRGLTEDVAALRRGDYCAESLRLERERFEMGATEKIDAGIDELVREVRDNPKAMEIFGDLLKALGLPKKAGPNGPTRSG